MAELGGLSMADAAAAVRKEAEKAALAQWGYNETRRLIEVRAELEADFGATRRNRTLWELIAVRMRESRYARTAEQCKCKWKNLVNRYKGKETMEAESGRQCPFFDELDAIFKERAKNMDQLLLESKGGLLKKKGKRGRKFLADGQQKLGDDDSDDDDEDEDEESEEERLLRRRASWAEKDRQKLLPIESKPSRVGGGSGSVQEVLENFLKHQQWLELEWREAVELREGERRARETEFREALLRLEQQRGMREAEWREREEQRREREEARSEKRDQLLEALVTKLAQE